MIRIVTIMLLGALATAAPAHGDDAPEAAAPPPPPLIDRDRYETLQNEVTASDRFRESRLRQVMVRARRALDENPGRCEEDLLRLRRSYRDEIEHLARRYRIVRADGAAFNDPMTALLLNTAFTDYAAALDHLARGNASRAATLLRRAENRRREAEDRMAGSPRSAAAPDAARVSVPPAR